MTTTLSSAFLISWGGVAGVAGGAVFDTAEVFDCASCLVIGAGEDWGADAAIWLSRLLDEAMPLVALGGGAPQLGKAMAEDKVKNATTAKRVVLLLSGFGLCGGELVLR
ncbi:hypothetical protein QUB46_02770 [Microcoleus sp. A6-D1]